MRRHPTAIFSRSVALGGGIVAASPAEGGELVWDGPDATDSQNHFRIRDFGAGSQDYYV